MTKEDEAVEAFYEGRHAAKKAEATELSYGDNIPYPPGCSEYFQYRNGWNSIVRKKRREQNDQK